MLKIAYKLNTRRTVKCYAIHHHQITTTKTVSGSLHHDTTTMNCSNAYLKRKANTTATWDPVIVTKYLVMFTFPIISSNDMHLSLSYGCDTVHVNTIKARVSSLRFCDCDETCSPGSGGCGTVHVNTIHTRVPLFSFCDCD